MGLTLDLQIDQLVLYDLPPAWRRQIAATVEHELARLLATEGAPTQLTNRRANLPIALHTVQVEPGLKAEAIGAQVARSLYGSLAQKTPQPAALGRESA